VPPVRHWQAGGFEPRRRAQYHPSKEILMRYAKRSSTCRPHGPYRPGMPEETNLGS